MSVEVRKIAEEIVAREGGFVNDADDPGGATNFGVTIHTMRALGLDLDGDGDTDELDVRALTRAQAVDIFLKHYYEGPRIGLLPEVLQASVFDMYVNAGANAVKILQRLLCEMGQPVDVDGVIGLGTAAAARKAETVSPDLLGDAYGIARRNYYFQLADARASNRKYVRTRSGGKGGWIRRAEEFMAPRFRLSDADFRKRVAAWA